ncbi:guanine deaminase [Histidinibacterium lentulum]|uniref:Guanine deaminase n=1 Tax=Histidinibacterium lentulum TaxID=2480588 RepID=A0A3N2QY98_9RHOB|nr:guanine deaminase [Histidinibacterium lentulum]ROU00189.1 guanine deaminase [Histidinibacterium lentulum]
MTGDLLLGQTLGFTGDPFAAPWEEVAVHRRRGGVLVDRGRIRAVGEADALRAAHPQARVHDYGQALISPGFVDAHMHYPQTPIVASWGKRLIDWLNGYTFPQEARLANPAVAGEAAEMTLDLAVAHGTTTLASFCTIHLHSADIFFEAAAARGMRVVAGRTCMDRNAPGDLRDDPRSAHDESHTLITKWHGRGRATYAITPRFSPTSSPEQLEALGALWAANPTCLMQTHLSEQTDEVAWVRELFPDARDYLDTYERYGLLGERGVYGHAIHLEPREIDRLAEVGAAVVHCPTSNAFIGSGLFDMGLARRLAVGLATDTGGGSSFSMLRTMAAAYEIAQLRGAALHPAELMWLATEGSARALHLGGVVGRLAEGAEADLVVLDLASTPAIAQRAARAESFWDMLFPTIMMGDDRAVLSVWIGGREVEEERP